MTLGGCAMQTAMTYAQHAGRGIATPTDLRYGMRYEARHFLDRRELEAKVEETQQWLQEDDKSGSEDESDTEEDLEEDSQEKEFTRSGCACEVCSGVNQVFDSWEDWNPTDQVQAFLKASISRTESALD